MSILRISSLAQILGLQLEGVPPKKALPKKGVVHLKKFDNHAKHILLKRILGGKSMGKAVGKGSSLSDRAEFPDKPEKQGDSKNNSDNVHVQVEPHVSNTINIDKVQIGPGCSLPREGGNSGGDFDRPDGSSDNR